jgi:hypothetical protein
MDRLATYKRPKDCTVAKLPHRTVREFKYKGGLELSAQFPFVEGSGDLKKAFDFIVTEPASATDSGQPCIDLKLIEQLSPPQNTCALLGVVGATTTEITWRTLKQIDGEIKVQAFVSIDSKAYDETSELNVSYFLTSDLVNLSYCFAQNADGTLRKRTAKERKAGSCAIRTVLPTIEALRESTEPVYSVPKTTGQSEQHHKDANEAALKAAVGSLFQSKSDDYVTTIRQNEPRPKSQKTP